MGRLSSNQRGNALVWRLGDSLEEENVWFRFMDFVMLPPKTLPDAHLVTTRDLRTPL